MAFYGGSPRPGEPMSQRQNIQMMDMFQRLNRLKQAQQGQFHGGGLTSHQPAPYNPSSSGQAAIPMPLPRRPGGPNPGGGGNPWPGQGGGNMSPGYNPGSGMIPVDPNIKKPTGSSFQLPHPSINPNWKPEWGTGRPNGLSGGSLLNKLMTASGGPTSGAQLLKATAGDLPKGPGGTNPEMPTVNQWTGGLYNPGDPNTQDYDWGKTPQGVSDEEWKAYMRGFGGNRWAAIKEIENRNQYFRNQYDMTPAEFASEYAKYKGDDAAWRARKNELRGDRDIIDIDETYSNKYGSAYSGESTVDTPQAGYAPYDLPDGVQAWSQKERWMYNQAMDKSVPMWRRRQFFLQLRSDLIARGDFGLGESNRIPKRSLGSGTNYSTNVPNYPNVFNLNGLLAQLGLLPSGWGGGGQLGQLGNDGAGFDVSGIPGFDNAGPVGGWGWGAGGVEGEGGIPGPPAPGPPPGTPGENE